MAEEPGVTGIQVSDIVRVLDSRHTCGRLQ